MENDRRDPLPEFDPAYIDQLLSAGNPVTKKEPQQPAAAEETVPVQPEAPAQVPSATPQTTSLRLALLIAVVCLLAGFLLGRLTPQPGPADPTRTTSTAPVDTRPPNIAVDYAAMSTKQLTDIAIQIPELKVFGDPAVSMQLTPAIYEELKTENPVLIELEQRPDAVEQLTFYNLVSSSLYGNPAATALIEYYVNYLGFDRYPPVVEVVPDCEWVLQDSELFTVYEYTKAPSVYFIMDEGGSGVTTVFDFDGYEFYLPSNMDAPADNANFWYRMELKPDGFGFASVPDPEPELTWISPSSSAWVTWQKSDQSCFVYGYTPAKADLTFTVYPSGNKQDIVLTISPPPEAVTDPADLAQSIFDQAVTLQRLSTMNSGKDLATYPIVEAVLAQPGGISTLLNLIQSNYPSMYSSVIDLRFSYTLSLLKLPAFQDRMTASESEAFQLLRGDSNVYLDLYDPLVPTVLETAEGLVLKERPDLWIGEKPENLSDIPVSEMDYWIYAPLTEGAMILRQPDWDLYVMTPPGSNNSKLGAWPVYNTDDQLTGWIISGKRENHYSLRLCLDQGDTELASQSLDVQPLNP